MTLRLKLLLVTALASAALVPLSAAPAHAAKGMEVAVQDDSVFVIQLPRPGYRAKGLKLATQLNVSWIRANVNWNYVTLKYKRSKKEPKNIVYNWTGYDALIAAAAKKGINVQLALTGPAPRWATGNHKIGPDRIKATPFKHFAAAAPGAFAGPPRRARRALPRPRAPLQHLERAEPPLVDLADQEPGEDLPRPLHGRLLGDQEGRLQRAGADRRDVTVLDRPRQARERPVAAEVPPCGDLRQVELQARPQVRHAQDRRLRAPSVRLRPQAELPLPGQGQRDPGRSRPARERSLEAEEGEAPDH